MSENAASPVSVRDLFQPIPGVYWRLPDAADVCSVLGIDPDMPVETLRRRLLWGERVEALAANDSRDVPTLPETAEYYLAFDAFDLGVEDTIRWLTSPENPPSSEFLDG